MFALTYVCVGGVASACIVSSDPSPPVFGVAIDFPSNSRNGNGFVGSGCFPFGDEGVWVHSAPARKVRGMMPR